VSESTATRSAGAAAARTANRAPGQSGNETPSGAATGASRTTTRTAPNRTPKATTRDRLLEAASELFYSEGTVAVGVDKICQQAQVSKRSLYQLFGTKDELVAESLRYTGESLLAQHLPLPDDVRPPRERILHVFRWLDEASGSDVFMGCPFVNTAIELKNAQAAGTVVAREYKQELTDFFEREAAAAGVEDPQLLAQQLTIAYDGCTARVVVTDRPLNGLAATTAAVLFDNAIKDGKTGEPA
jgi:AcrR family transcriptional regulator